MAGLLRRDKDLRADALVFAESLIVPEEERVVLPNRPPQRSPELVPPECRDRCGIKVISSVQRAVAQKLIRIAVELIRPRARNRVDDATGGPPILSRIVTRQYGKLLDGIHS